MTIARPNHSTHRRTGRSALAGGALLLALLLVFGEVAAAGAITRRTIVDRSARWVDLGVPYSQSLFFEGYRQDCSGFVSMSWQLTDSAGRPISPPTDVLPAHADAIAKDRLLPGDMIVRPRSEGLYGHAVVFGGWADDARTTYWCYEQSNSAGGARLRQTPYPYWSSAGEGFAPYRYQGVTEDLGRTIRIHGTNRYATAAAASANAFPDPSRVSTVVVATGESWPDALGASGLAGAVRGPVLLTRKETLTAPARAEIVRLAPVRALVIGGGEAVSDEVLAELRAAGVGSVERIGGANRYETASLVARKLATEVAAAGGTFSRHAYIATGEEFADALAVSPVAAHRVRPVLLVNSAGVPGPTAAALADLGVTRATIVGGEAAVGRDVRDTLAASGLTVSRIWGANRYLTALAVADHGVAEGLSRSQAGIAAGSSFPDALAAGPAVGLGATPAVLYLTPHSGINAALYNELRIRRAQVGVPRVYGGPAILPDRIRAEATAAIRGW